MKNKQRSSTLLKKLNEQLDELDHLVNKFFSLQPDDPSFQHIHVDIEQRLTFVQNLFSAEMASCPTSSQQYPLENMWERFQEIEAAFRGFGTCSGTTASSTIDHVDNVGDVNADDGDDEDHCSCTKSSVNDEEEVEDGDDVESTLGQCVGVCVDLVQEGKVTPVKVYTNVLFEEKVDNNDRVEYVFDDQVKGDMSSNGISIEDVCHNRFDDRVKGDMSSNDVSTKDVCHSRVMCFEDLLSTHSRVEDVFDEMSHIGAAASIEDVKEKVKRDLKEPEKKKKKGLGCGKLCGSVMTVFVIGMFSMALSMIEIGDGHGHILTPT